MYLIYCNVSNFENHKNAKSLHPTPPPPPVSPTWFINRLGGLLVFFGAHGYDKMSWLARLVSTKYPNPMWRVTPPPPRPKMYSLVLFIKKQNKNDHIPNHACVL